MNTKKVTARFMLEAMSNLRTRATGVVNAVIWVSAGEFHGKDLAHGPRIKVMPGPKLTSDGVASAASVTISDSPKVIGNLTGNLRKQAIAFVALNKDTLLKHWKGEIDTQELLEGIRPIEG